MPSFLNLLISLACLCPQLILGKDLGTYGHTFPVIEENYLEYLKAKLNALSSQERIKLQASIKEDILNVINSPAKVEGLRTASQYRVFYYDPTIYLQKDIQDREGNVILQKGTSINPLKQFSLKRDLIFFDGDNNAHIDWARENPNTMWILVKGSSIKLEMSENREVFFDQKGLLTEKIGFLNIPAKVSQEDLRLKVEEIPVGEGE
jgi:conjugal transfer pilus assembly protein TraW